MSPASPNPAPDQPDNPNQPNPDDPCQGNACGIATRADVQANGLRLDQLTALMQGGDLALLTAMNGKMDAMLASIAAVQTLLVKFMKWSQLGRILEIMTFVTTLHNAYMLSNALTQTLFSMFSNVLAVIGIDDADGTPLDVGRIVGNTVESAAKKILGVEEVDGIKAGWKKYSRIYQAAANLMFSLQSIGYSILGALEVVGSWNAKIGNALQKYGVIGEKALGGWMNTTPDFQNRFFTAIQNTQEIAESIEQVASEVLEGRESVAQLELQKVQLEAAIKDYQGTPPPEHKPTADAAKEAKENSVSPPIAATDETQPGA